MMSSYCRGGAAREKWESTRGDRGSASFPQSERMTLLGNRLNELYGLNVALIGNNELVILSTRKQTVKDTIFLYSENFDISYNHSTNIRSTE